MICKLKKLQYSVQQLENKNVVHKRQKKKKEVGVKVGKDQNIRLTSFNLTEMKVKPTIHFCHFYPWQRGCLLHFPSFPIFISV